MKLGFQESNHCRKPTADIYFINFTHCDQWKLRNKWLNISHGFPTIGSNQVSSKSRELNHKYTQLLPSEIWESIQIQFSSLKCRLNGQMEAWLYITLKYHMLSSAHIFLSLTYSCHNLPIFHFCFNLIKFLPVRFWKPENIPVYVKKKMRC